VNQVSTTGAACQAPNAPVALHSTEVVTRNTVMAQLAPRCTYCWTLKTGLSKDGRFVSYRVFCHHRECPDWREVHAKIETAPVMHWAERYVAEIRSGAPWDDFKARVGEHADWLGVPTERGTLLVFANQVAGLEGLGFQAATHDREELEFLVDSVPQGRRLRKPSKISNVPAKTRSIGVLPSLDYMLPGVLGRQLGELCEQAGIQTVKTGFYQDCIESVDPISFEQANLLAALLQELKGGLVVQD
jgi:hypothetical protein